MVKGTGRHTYTTGQKVRLEVTIEDNRDSGFPHVKIGSGFYNIDVNHLDASDQNPMRPLTAEEKDLAELEAAGRPAEPERQSDPADPAPRGWGRGTRKSGDQA